MAMTDPLEGPLCQSCGMPLTSPEDFGSNVDGTENGEVLPLPLPCRRLHRSHHHRARDDREGACEWMAHQGVMPEGLARILMNGVIPNLKRWRP